MSIPTFYEPYNRFQAQCTVFKAYLLITQAECYGIKKSLQNHEFQIRLIHLTGFLQALDRHFPRLSDEKIKPLHPQHMITPNTRLES